MVDWTGFDEVAEACESGISVIDEDMLLYTDIRKEAPLLRVVKDVVLKKVWGEGPTFGEA